LDPSRMMRYALDIEWHEFAAAYCTVLRGGALHRFGPAWPTDPQSTPYSRPEGRIKRRAAETACR
jgi:hypothetical protein